MSDDFTESIWIQFAIEAEEHLSSIETALIACEKMGSGASASSHEVTFLFRAFHSLKGLSTALDLGGIESLTHVAEDLLELVRQGQAVLDATHVPLLLETADALKALCHIAVLTRKDSSVSGDLIQRLKEECQRAGSTAPVAGPLPQGGAGSDSGLVPVSLTAMLTTPYGLHDDPQMVTFYAEVLQENIPAVAAFFMFCEDMDPLLVRYDICKQAADALETIAYSSESMGLDVIAGEALELLASVTLLLSDSDYFFSADEYASLVLHVLELNALLVHLEREYGLDAGIKFLAPVLAQKLKNDYLQAFEAIVLDMDVLDKQLRDADTAGVAVAEPDRPLLTQLMQNFCTLQRCYSALLPQSCSYLLLLLEDLLGKALKGEMKLSQEFYELMRSALIIVQQEYNHAYDPQPQEEDEQDLALRHDLLLERIRSLASLSDALHEREKIAAAISDLSSGITISPELKALMTHENIIDLMEQFEQGRQLYEISVDLESSEDVAIQFMGWVEERGTMITSHYQFHGDKSICMILLLSTASFEQVSKELHAIDDQVFVRSCQAGATLASAPSLNTTPVAPATFQVPVASDHVEIKVSGGQPDPGASPASMIRVAGATLDLLMNRVGELVLLHAQLSHALSDAPAQAARIRLKRLLSNVDPVNRTGSGKEGGNASNASNASNANINDVMEILQEQQSKLEEVEERIHASLSRLQEGALELRVVPIETVLRRLPRMVRDISLSQNKKIRLDMQGQEVRIDKAMVEVLTDPLMHMVRNSADHGIDLPAKRVANGKPEEGCISIKAFQQGPRVVIRVSDDGLGIDHRAVLQKAIAHGLVAPHQGEQLSREAIYDFLFMPGFSTAKVVTEISGRGVGLDVVRNNVMRLGGTIQVQSELGQGTTFTLDMPLSAAVQDAMLVAVGGQTLALPARFVIEVLEVDHHDIQTIKGREAVLLRGAFLPLVHMADLLGFALEPRTQRRTSYAVVVLSNGQQMVGVVVDKMVGRRDLFIKDIPARLAALPGVGGASILGDGKVVLILDGEALLRLAQSMRTSSILSQSAQPADSADALEPELTALLPGVS